MYSPQTHVTESVQTHSESKYKLFRMDSEGSIWNVGSIRQNQLSWITYLCLFCLPATHFSKKCIGSQLGTEAIFLKLFYWLDPFILINQSKVPFPKLTIQFCPIYMLIIWLSKVWSAKKDLIGSFQWISSNCFNEMIQIFDTMFH